MTDAMLRSIVSVINNIGDDTTVGVTLTAKGLVISSQIIPNTVWLGAVQQQVVAVEGDTPDGATRTRCASSSCRPSST